MPQLIQITLRYETEVFMDFENNNNTIINTGMARKISDLRTQLDEYKSALINKQNEIEHLKHQLNNNSPRAIENKLNHLINNTNFLVNCTSRKLANEDDLYYVIIKGVLYGFYDGFLSQTVHFVANELNYDYPFDNIDFKEGDVVVDIGGNVGMVSIYLAKIYPFLKIYAFEPVKENYENFLKNIKLNNIPDGIITLENKAVTKDGRKINMNIVPSNKGGSSISDIAGNNCNYQKDNLDIESITLNEIFKQHKITKLKLLKIDCEGSEYEILYNANKTNLKKITAIRGEFHSNKNIEELISYCKEYIGDVIVTKCQ